MRCQNRSGHHTAYAVSPTESTLSASIGNERAYAVFSIKNALSASIGKRARENRLHQTQKLARHTEDKRERISALIRALPCGLATARMSGRSGLTRIETSVYGCSLWG
ncbi:hypothetical protein BaRGS_00039162 [Batillaria attramentaria]|uniref:BHLH domain-containing protein n=1 Tax=Batillaria attramentaria TaxID=370345 RepID=A0ABD0J2U9_9CAEN